MFVPEKPQIEKSRPSKLKTLDSPIPKLKKFDQKTDTRDVSMSGSAEREGAGMVIGVEQTDRRSVRRRLVQSTLLPHNSVESEPIGDLRDESAVKEEDVDGGDDDVCGSQGKKTRKRKGKTTPPTGASKKRGKGKSPLKPKNNATTNGIPPAYQITIKNLCPMPNLRLEAKLKAEENSRMFEGKQVHPFFSSWKSGKRNLGTAEVEITGSPGERKQKGVNIGPIHVFERGQDDVAIDWTNWTFCKETSGSSLGQDFKVTAAYNEYVNGFKTQNVPTDLYQSDMPIIQSQENNQYASQPENILTPFPGVSALSCDDHQTGCSKIFEGSEGVCEGDEVDFLSCNACLSKLGNEHQNGSPLKSGQPQNCLWIDKYQPKTAMEVCGNTELVKLMNDWLHRWHEGGLQAAKDFASGDKQSKLDNYGDYCESDSDMETMDAGSCLKNVLLVTGPVGSGKSAAIHACAKEQGFKILESNASDCRSGALVKQKFGEALESHCLTRSLESPLGSQDVNNSKPIQFIPDGAALQEHHDLGIIEVIPLSDDEAETHCDSTNVKSLILFEDVDICFPDDRGFISAIQQISEKAKGPVILTSNSTNHDLPNNLNRLELSFTMPALEELSHHLSLVCAAEKLNAEPGLIEQLIEHCQGDIRKTIMHLQFWFQNKRFKTARKVQNTCGSTLFDAEVGHRRLPMMMPWDLPSQLSLQVEDVIAKSLSTLEDATLLDVFVQEVANDKMLNTLLMYTTETDNAEAKKDAMIRRNFALEDYGYEDFLNFPCEHPNSSDVPLPVSRCKARRKSNVVLSSDSEDEALNDKHPVLSTDHTTNGLVFADIGQFLSLRPDVQNDMHPSVNISLPTKTEISEKNGYSSESAAVSCMGTTCKSLDVSYVPESTMVPETEIDNGPELSSGTISSGHFVRTVEVSTSEDFRENLSQVDISMDRATRNSEMTRNSCEATGESSYGEEIEDSFSREHMRSIPEFQVADECSQMNFNKIAKPAVKFRPSTVSDSVQESWRKFRLGDMDLKRYLDAEPSEAPQILELTYQMSNVISEADLCLSRCQKLFSSEPTAGPSQNSDTFCLYDELQQMTSDVARQEFCYCAKTLSAVGSELGLKTCDDVNWEILSLMDQEARLGLEKTQECSAREKMSDLVDRIKPIVPPRSYLALKGHAFHEYVSSLGCISRSDTSLSQGIDRTKRRRSRAARHYLSTGSLMFTLEDISLLDRHSTFGKTS